MNARLTTAEGRVSVLILREVSDAIVTPDIREITNTSALVSQAFCIVLMIFKCDSLFKKVCTQVLHSVMDLCWTGWVETWEGLSLMIGFSTVWYHVTVMMIDARIVSQQQFLTWLTQPKDLIKVVLPTQTFYILKLLLEISAWLEDTSFFHE